MLRRRGVNISLEFFSPGIRPVFRHIGSKARFECPCIHIVGQRTCVIVYNSVTVFVPGGIERWVPSVHSGILHRVYISYDNFVLLVGEAPGGVEALIQAFPGCLAVPCPVSGCPEKIDRQNGRFIHGNISLCVGPHMMNDKIRILAVFHFTLKKHLFPERNHGGFPALPVDYCSSFIRQIKSVIGTQTREVIWIWGGCRGRCRGGRCNGRRRGFRCGGRNRNRVGSASAKRNSDKKQHQKHANAAQKRQRPVSHNISPFILFAQTASHMVHIIQFCIKVQD